MAIEIVDLPIENGGSFHSYARLPEGKCEKNTEEKGGSFSIKRILENIKFGGFKNGTSFGPDMIIQVIYGLCLTRVHPWAIAVTTFKVFKGSWHKGHVLSVDGPHGPHVRHEKSLSLDTLFCGY